MSLRFCNGYLSVMPFLGMSMVYIFRGNRSIGFFEVVFHPPWGNIIDCISYVFGVQDSSSREKLA
jgi:hypothetical protein